MKHIERLSLIDRIGRELQARMTYSDISSYLAGFGIDTSKQTSGVNSKWVYVKDLLADARPDVIVRIADELEIPHRYTVKPTLDVAESSFWNQITSVCSLVIFRHLKKRSAVFKPP